MVVLVLLHRISTLFAHCTLGSPTIELWEHAMIDRNIGQIVPIADRAIGFWSDDIKRDNREFLESLSPDYFISITKLALAMANTDEEHFAASHLRSIRDQAAEMLFALLFASIQSPRGVALWMLSYINKDIDYLIQRIRDYQSVRTTHGTRKLSWLDVVEMTTSTSDPSPAELAAYRVATASFLKKLASECTSKLTKRQYASFKHGLRVRHGGGGEITITPHSDTSKQYTLKGSKHGSSFLEPRLIKDTKFHFTLQHHHVYWSLDATVAQITAITILIKNVINLLLKVNGHCGVVYYQALAESDYERCWQSPVGLQNVSLVRCEFSKEQIESLTQEEMIAKLESSNANNPK